MEEEQILKVAKHHVELRRSIVTCYFRHLRDVFAKAGIDVTSENKKEVDRAIHDMVGVDYKNCPAAWREVKKRIAEDEEGFVAELRESWGKRT